VKMTLGKIKVHEDMSQETTCFSCDILLDGKVVGHASNDGGGGCDMIYWKDHAKGKIVEDWANAQKVIIPAGHGMPEWELEHEKLDHFIGELLDKTDIAIRQDRQYKRWVKKSMVFRLKGDKPDAFRTSKAPYSPTVKAAIVAKYGNQIEVILNDNMPPLEIPFFEVNELARQMAAFGGTNGGLGVNINEVIAAH
jgi:hypothetical protein